MNLSKPCKCNTSHELLSSSHSDLSLSVRARPFKNIYELFHVKTSFRELNKNRDSYVFRQLSNNERCGIIKSSLPGPLTSISFTGSCLNVWNVSFSLRYNFPFSLTKRSKKVVVFSKTLYLFSQLKPPTQWTSLNR